MSSCPNEFYPAEASEVKSDDRQEDGRRIAFAMAKIEYETLDVTPVVIDKVEQKKLS